MKIDEKSQIEKMTKVGRLALLFQTHKHWSEKKQDILKGSVKSAKMNSKDVVLEHINSGFIYGYEQQFQTIYGKDFKCFYF